MTLPKGIEDYVPPVFLPTGHMQTIYPSLFRKLSPDIYFRERINTPDGDFLDLDWSKIGSKKIAIISHGMEGSAHRHYVVGMATPLPAAPTVILVEWTFFLLSNMHVTLEMTASNTPSLPGDLPAFESGGTIIPLSIGGGCYNGIAQIGESCGLPTEIRSFGSIKALYR